jgi:two-component system response regulator RegA
VTEHTELDLPEDKTLLLVDDDEPLRNQPGARDGEPRF